jgi:uncharacterized membrane protein YfcA
MKAGILIALAAVSAVFTVTWIADLRRRRAVSAAGADGRVSPGPLAVSVGFVTNFFDTLGIGSFATTTSMYKLRRMVDDRVIPGTLNVGHSLPVITQAFIYIVLVDVEPWTLLLLIGASVAGAWLGAGVVSGWPRRRVQIGMGTALLVAATLMFMTQLGLVPGGGEAHALAGPRLAAAIAGNFALGSLMTLGIGLYAPCMIMISLLGMNPAAAFPIMMGSCAFLMPVGSARFIRRGAYARRAAVGLTLGGVPAVLIAAYLVTSLPVHAVRWLVIGVVVYTAVAMLRSAAAGKRAGNSGDALADVEPA